MAQEGSITTAVICTFCGKTQDEVRAMVLNEAATAAICDECVGLCLDLMRFSPEAGAAAK